MSLLLNIIFFCQALLLAVLIVTRNPARLPGFEKTRNQNLDRLILIIISSFLLVLLLFKCR
uniref:protein-export membrane protein SecG n=1 Tax=Lietzensia polymorpha TaxID=2962110 RepID=UPI0021824DEC|nr:protein-export membrane protein SecG [Lietzensia polymorpha]UVI61298.1 protein-export membrane protein SecG [Lietzensia polymorpha]